MKRRKFIKGTAAGSLVAGSLSASAYASHAEEREYYEVREYSLRGAGIPGSLASYLKMP